MAEFLIRDLSDTVYPSNLISGWPDPVWGFFIDTGTWK